MDGDNEKEITICLGGVQVFFFLQFSGTTPAPNVYTIRKK